VFISGKQVEELGYEKISRRQAQLQDLRIAIVDDMRISEPSLPINDMRVSLLDLLPNLLELDLSRNLYEKASVILQLCLQLPSIKSLALDGNRLSQFDANDLKCPSVKSLSLNTMLLFPNEVADLVQSFPNLRQISLSGNVIHDDPFGCHLPHDLSSVVAEDCKFEDLLQAFDLARSCPSLQTLGLKNNLICRARTTSSDGSAPGSINSNFPSSLHTLDVSGNNIQTWSFVDDLQALAPALEHLRILNNPIYTASEGLGGKLLSENEVSSLVIARLPRLKTLNYSTVTAKERLNGEKLYLSLAAEAIASNPEDQEEVMIRNFPRYRELCEEYGEPAIQRQSKDIIDPNSLAARLIKCHFYMGEKEKSKKLSIPLELQIETPKSFSIYSVLGLVGKRLGTLPKDISLIWETGEKDPVIPAIKGKQGVQEWDSEDEDDSNSAAEWANRDIELIPGTRPIGTVIEKSEARIRVLLRDTR